MFNLEGRKAVVTGAGQGMGFGIARALSEAGAHVFVNDLHAERAEAAAAKLNNAAPLPGDITDAAIRAGFLETTGKIDILVNNAGVPEGMLSNLATSDNLAEEDYARQMNLNHHAVRGLCRLYVPHMRKAGHGRIMITTAEAHRLGLSIGISHYAAAKSATLGYMRSLAAEIGKDGVTMNALSLGTMNNFDGHERAAASTIMGRAGSAEDVGAAALYLCSDEAGWMTGQTLPLNGGACTA